MLAMLADASVMWKENSQQLSVAAVRQPWSKESYPMHFPSVPREPYGNFCCCHFTVKETKVPGFTNVPRVMLVADCRFEWRQSRARVCICLSWSQYQSERRLIEKSLQGHKGSIKSRKGLARVSQSHRWPLTC